MAVIDEAAAPRRVRLEALARDRGVRRRADRARPWTGNAFAAELAERMPRETGHAVRGLGRSPGRRGRPGLVGAGSRRWATSASR